MGALLRTPRRVDECVHPREVELIRQLPTSQRARVVNIVVVEVLIGQVSGSDSCIECPSNITRTLFAVQEVSFDEGFKELFGFHSHTRNLP